MEVDIKTICKNILKNSISDIDTNVLEISKALEDVPKSNKKNEKRNKKKYKKPLNKWSFWLNLLALLCPLWGVFCVFYNLYKYPKRSQGVLIFTVIGFVIQLLLILFVYFRLFDLLNQYFILFLG